MEDDIMNNLDKDRLDSLKQDKLCIIFDLRNTLIELYPDIKNLDKYIIANEMLNKLEQQVWKE